MLFKTNLIPFKSILSKAGLEHFAYRYKKSYLIAFILETTGLLVILGPWNAWPTQDLSRWGKCVFPLSSAEDSSFTLLVMLDCSKSLTSLWWIRKRFLSTIMRFSRCIFRPFPFDLLISYIILFSFLICASLSRENYGLLFIFPAAIVWESLKQYNNSVISTSPSILTLDFWMRLDVILILRP